MRFMMFASVIALSAFSGSAMAEAPADAIGRICKSEDILMHAKKVKITSAYQAEICPCIVDQIKAKAKPAEIQALADALKLPLDARRTAMMSGKNRTLSMGSRAFLQAQMTCGRDHPLPKK
jgi:hypothetical protein